METHTPLHKRSTWRTGKCRQVSVLNACPLLAVFVLTVLCVCVPACTPGPIGNATGWPKSYGVGKKAQDAEWAQDAQSHRMAKVLRSRQHHSPWAGEMGNDVNAEKAPSHRMAQVLQSRHHQSLWEGEMGNDINAKKTKCTGWPKHYRADTILYDTQAKGRGDTS